MMKNVLKPCGQDDRAVARRLPLNGGHASAAKLWGISVDAENVTDAARKWRVKLRVSVRYVWPAIRHLACPPPVRLLLLPLTSKFKWI